MASSSSSSSISSAAQLFFNLSLTLFLFCSFSSALRYPSSHQTQLGLSTEMIPAKGQAERLIRSLNLFPKHDANIVLNDQSAKDAPAISERQFNLNVTGAAPGPSIQQFGHYAGYYSLPSTKGAKMFYFFFESRVNKTDAPVVIWLTGGPGCASELALFYENGPFQIKEDMSLVWNDFGWDQASNILYVDQPTGTGFSYTTDDSDIRHNEVGVSNDMYNFLQEFFKGHPKYAANDFFITGESYAGHYIPALASRIYKGNTNKEGIHVNLKGFAIGNGLTDPAFQYKAYPEYALAAKLISKSDHDSIVSQLVPPCESAISACSQGQDACIDAFSTCNRIFNSILNIAGSINYYDIRKQCQGSLCYDFSRMETFLSDDKVKSALGVKDIDFVSCSSQVYDAMVGDWMQDYEVGIPALLESGIKVLIYAGEYDLICNWVGNSNWVNGMKWSGQKKFQSAQTVPFVAGNTKSGELKSYGPLAFLKVYNAGHMVPMDQPKAALQMLEGWMQGKLSLMTTASTKQKISLV
ncbi:Serine carboxypeptidase-like 48 [Linum perenne]